jgi:hypothetical protein
MLFADSVSFAEVAWTQSFSATVVTVVLRTAAVLLFV